MRKKKWGEKALFRAVSGLIMEMAVKTYVLKKRKKLAEEGCPVDVRFEWPQESGEMPGESYQGAEFAMLLDRHLMRTEIGCGAWENLTGEILDGVYQLVRRRQNQKRNRKQRRR